MKKISIVFLLLVLCMSAFSQRKSKLLARDALFEFNKQTGIKLQVPYDTLSYRLSYTNYCLYKFQKENMIAFSATIIGAGVVFGASNNSINGIDSANEHWDVMVKIAGSSVEKRIMAERKWEAEIDRLNERNKKMVVAGGVFMLGGGVLHVLSYRWLKRAYLVPIENGIAVQMNF
jgi:hypothetical protein